MLIRIVEKKWLNHRWLTQSGVALGYALAYLMIVESLSNAPWPFVAGLRIAWLLLVPYRYWIALAVGEAVPLVYRNLGFADGYGSTWVLLASVPPLIIKAPVRLWAN
ncbi:hypothetical protein [Dyella sp.]|uniref:hypothetical protein n=1 Tax=Dyella sp. TaxID=1869338 RepID=UPI002FDB45FE